MDIDSDSGSDLDEEAPQVVVLKKGDLTAEQAEEEQKRIEKGKWTKPIKNRCNFCIGQIITKQAKTTRIEMAFENWILNKLVNVSITRYDSKMFDSPKNYRLNRLSTFCSVIFAEV